MISAKRQMSAEDAIQVLLRGKHGVLSTSTLDGIPYGVPLNYFYVQEDNAIYFHCFIKGRKLDNLYQNDRVSFVVVGIEKIVADRFVTHYDSVMITGRTTFITDNQEKVKNCSNYVQYLPLK